MPRAFKLLTLGDTGLTPFFLSALLSGPEKPRIKRPFEDSRSLQPIRPAVFSPADPLDLPLSVHFHIVIASRVRLLLIFKRKEVLVGELCNVSTLAIGVSETALPGTLFSPCPLPWCPDAMK
jgi:hypothetical protein